VRRAEEKRASRRCLALTLSRWYFSPCPDPVIAMARDRHKKGLQVESQKRSVAGLSGGVLHKQLELADLEREIKILEEGVQEYQDQINLHNERKHDVEKAMVKDVDWCEKFDRLIGPFEQKYEECKAEVKVSFDHAKSKYNESLQKLIDDFGFHPCARMLVTPAHALAQPPTSRRTHRP
jgi:hypothetical protein